MGSSLFSKKIMIIYWRVMVRWARLFFWWLATGPWLLATGFWLKKRGADSNDASYLLSKNKIISSSKKVKNHPQNNSSRATDPESQEPEASDQLRAVMTKDVEMKLNLQIEDC